MRFRVTMKDPDTLYDAIRDALDENKLKGVSDDEWETLKESRAEDVAEVCGLWFEYGEYLTVEIDTDTKTCVVVPKDGL